ncbi:DapH/DapD/GlmU-related protein [Paraburkholderia sp. SARCC-3016]|uniref:DapH/DapD/GlmU-related protein n=1 Tax=Paraburkholderia sp. SARCC-3016 TaxID=3058611 RepID=UPI0028081678|nr:DapH/DapD/GlmU-related protein [Paraburkholderia sp. SARCC-3016]MDQ7982101.1 DapH/DapD/GlmU-related protein [Paraburkholderia sp. SARCC-3016]
MTDSNSAYGAGLATVAGDGTILDTWFPVVRLNTASPAVGSHVLSNQETFEKLGKRGLNALAKDPVRDVQTIAIETLIEDLSQPPVDIHDLYLRFHLLSYRLIRPREANLEGFLTLLSDVAWTSLGPCKPEKVEELLWNGRGRGTLVDVRGVFKLPRMIDYVAPSDIWIADVNRVLLGAHLAPGTAVMPEGFCSLNAGTMGPCMVEGRISLGVIVGAGTDIGGGASIMGTTSGGGKHVVSIGERCLLGANSGVGISLGDDCVVEAGLYITAGSLVTLPSGDKVKALTLSGKSGVLFRRNSASGIIEALPAKKSWGGLNPQIHQPGSISQRKA